VASSPEQKFGDAIATIKRIARFDEDDETVDRPVVQVANSTWLAWSVDRLGRSLQDLVGFLSELHALQDRPIVRQQGLDTTTPAGKAMFQMMGVFAEFERAIIQERSVLASRGPGARVNASAWPRAGQGRG
jgi:Resolvase, N terminal domain